jgi:hypothetical protein
MELSSIALGEIPVRKVSGKQIKSRPVFLVPSNTDFT